MKKETADQAQTQNFYPKAPFDESFIPFFLGP